MHQRLVGETLGEPDGVVLIDESGVVKQGSESVGVAAQDCGAVGKVANSQVGVYLGYAGRKGYSLVTGQLFMPEVWFRDAYATKRQACGVPADVAFQTKPELGLTLLQDTVARGTLPFQWVAADALYGMRPHSGMAWRPWASGTSRKSSAPHCCGAVVQPSICRCAKDGDGGQPAGGSPPLRRSRCAPAPW